MLSLQALNLAVAVPQPNAADPSGYYAWGRSWLEDGDSNPANQLTIGVVFPVIQINGRPTLVNRYPIGWSAAVFPFMVLGKEMLGARAADYTHIGLAPLVVRVAWIGVYLWILLGVLATYDSIRRPDSGWPLFRHRAIKALVPLRIPGCAHCRHVRAVRQLGLLVTWRQLRCALDCRPVLGLGVRTGVALRPSRQEVACSARSGGGFVLGIILVDLWPASRPDQLVLNLVR